MLIDTSGWFCIFDSGEIHHQEASAFYESATELVTHNYILAEFVALSEARKKNRAEMLFFLSRLLIDSEIRVVW